VWLSRALYGAMLDFFLYAGGRSDGSVAFLIADICNRGSENGMSEVIHRRLEQR
jgi:hypothetical protein